MSPKQLQTLSYKKLFKVYRQLSVAAKTDSQLVPLAELAEKLWLQTSNLADARLLAAAQKRDKGEILFVVFRPILCGQPGSKTSYGVRETIRTPHCIGDRSQWKSDREVAKINWRAAVRSDDTDINWDFRQAMKVEAA